MKQAKSRGGRIFVYAAAALAASSLVARADTVEVSAAFDGGANGPKGTEIVDLSSNYNDNNSPSDQTQKSSPVYAGVYDFTLAATPTATPGVSDALGGPGSPASLGTPIGTQVTNVYNALTDTGATTMFQAVCIDLADNIPTSPQPAGGIYAWYVENLTSVPSEANPGSNGVGVTSAEATAIAILTENYDKIIGTPTAEQSAVYQMAVWDVLYNPNAGFASTPAGGVEPNLTLSPDTAYTPFGYTSVTGSGAGNDIATALADATAATTVNFPTEVGYPVYALVGEDVPQQQDFSLAIIVGSSGSSYVPLSVPLPASAGVGFAMLGAFGGLAALRKRSSRKSRIVE